MRRPSATILHALLFAVFCVPLAVGCSTDEATVVASRGPVGLYIALIAQAAIQSAEAATDSTAEVGARTADSTVVAPPDTDAILTRYFERLLDDPAVAGLAPQIKWSTLNPAAGTYSWNVLDDVFAAVDEWNGGHPGAAPKTVQLLLSAGFNSPAWVFDRMTSCDGLFVANPGAPVSSACGYTTIFFETESGAPSQIPLPMPWAAPYTAAWTEFLAALEDHLGREPSSGAFVSVAVAGPTASSAEMILPNETDNPGDLTLPATSLAAGETPLPGVTAPGAWDLLFKNHYGATSPYVDSEQAFIDAWKGAIDTFGRIFEGVTLVLTATVDGLPIFPDAAPSLSNPAPGFEPDCSSPNMNCAAVTQVLAYFTTPGVGGRNAKATQESGMTASVYGDPDLRSNGVRWLASQTASGAAHLPGRSSSLSQILGGLQFAHSFSTPTDTQSEGCPGYPDTVCDHLSPEQALANVLAVFFTGTSVAGSYGAPSSVHVPGFTYADAPLNFLEIYDGDFLYAEGLGGCSLSDVAGAASGATPGCAVSMGSRVDAAGQTAQQQLDVAGQQVLAIAEPALVPVSSP